MAAIVCLALSEVRRRWRSLAAVALLVALAGGAMLACVAGARRTASSFDRLLTWTRSQDVALLGHGFDRHDIEAIRALPDVEAVGTGRVMGLVTADGAFLGGGGVFAPLDDVLGREVYRVRIVDGRAPVDGAAEEIALSETLARSTGLRVGDSLPVGSFTQEQLEQFRNGLDAGEPAGPSLELRVVGISRSPDDLNVQSSSGGVLVLPRAFADKYGEDIGGWFGQGIGLIAIRLHQGTDVGEFVEHLNAVLEPGSFDVDPVALTRGGVQESIDLLAMATLLTGAVVGTAGLIAVALAITGQVTLIAGGQMPVRDLGLDRRARVAAIALPPLLFAGVGSLAATASAWAISGAFPVGVARDAEPHPGPQLDPLVLPIGTVVVFVLIAGIVVLAARSTVRATSSAMPALRRPSRLGRALDALGLAPPATIGVHMALEPGRGPTAAPVRSALAGAALAVFSISGAATFGASFDHVLATPGAHGRQWDAAVVDATSRPVDQDQPCGAATTQLLERPAFEAVAVACTGSVTLGGWATGVVGVTPLLGPMQPTMLAGRPPTAPDEIALGSHTLRALGLDLGDVATVPTPGGLVDYRIVGRVIVPRVLDPQAIADGAVVTGDGFDRIRSAMSQFESVVVVRLPADADKTAALAGLARLPGVGSPFSEGVIGISVPIEVERLNQLDRVPDALAGLLAALGTLAVGYLLLSSVRWRSRDLAVMKSLGFRPRQLMATVGCQAVTVAAFGILVGMLPGVAAGAAAWRMTADNVGVLGTVSVPVLALAAIALSSVALAIVVSAIPARRTAKLPAATILHTA
jgi:hypothetical protein